MTKSRIEAFSDGVIAIIITIMVLEIKIPHGPEWQDLQPLVPVFFSYLMSFIFVGIYWGNHHHLLHTMHQINSSIIWTNMMLLFFLSLIPFSTGWMGEHHFSHIPVTVYAINLLCCAISYYLLQSCIMATSSHHPELRDALTRQKKKGIISLCTYMISIPCAYFAPWIAAVLFILLSIVWLIPDRNIEAALKKL